MTTTAKPARSLLGAGWAPVVLTVLTGVVVAAVAAAAGGSRSMWGALAGTAVVVVFFAVGVVALRFVATAAPALLLLVALMTYGLQVVALLAVYAAFQSSPELADSVSPRWLGIAALTGTLAWTAGLVRAHQHERIALYDLDGETS